MLFDEASSPVVLIRGGGDLASGVALRLQRAGFKILITELAAPRVVRRRASFAQAVFDGVCQVEEVTGFLAESVRKAEEVMQQGKVAVMVDPNAEARFALAFFGLVDGRMTKALPDLGMDAAPRVIGLGPGFVAGVNCHAVVETNRGPFLGRVYWQGSAEADSGIPESVKGFNVERVLYAPKSGILIAKAKIGDLLEPGSIIASIEGEQVVANFKGVLRGLIHDGLKVQSGMKIAAAAMRLSEERQKQGEGTSPSASQK